MIKFHFLVFILLALNITLVEAQTFEQQQLSFSRVRDAKSTKDKAVKDRFEKKGVDFPGANIYFRAFKKEQELEVWAKKNGKYILIHTYDICKNSGVLGPKRKEGDLQVPEGYYRITTFNPASRFHLSLKVNYPNKSDKILSDKQKPGGDIYVHGSCVTIGCIPIEDKYIKEVYWMCVLAKSNGQNTIPITIYPAKMTDAKMRKLETDYKQDPELLKFWQNIKIGFDYFEKHKKLPTISFLSNGLMAFQ